MVRRITEEIRETEDTITIGELVSTMFYLKNKMEELEKENKRLKKLCAEKDSFFKEMISDGLRHKSNLLENI